MSGILHIVNGTETQHGMEAAGIAGKISEFADVLHDGPVPPDDDMDEWLSVRSRFIADCGWATYEEALATSRLWHQALESFRDYDEVVLWYEHDVFDQLLLIRHLSWWWKHAPMDPPSLVSPADYLGPMESGRLRELFEARTRITEAQLTLASSAWQAFTSDDPRELVRIVRHENTNDLPHLQGALLRMLEEYPSTHNGLGCTEQQMLEILALSPLTVMDLFAACARREERVFMGDTTFLVRLQRMMSRQVPLITRKSEDAPLHITDDGSRVLAGEADDVALNGIDRWIGGVHLTYGNVWRWTGEELAMGAES